MLSYQGESAQLGLPSEHFQRRDERKDRVFTWHNENYPKEII